MPPPEFYDDWSPDEHACEHEAIREARTLHWNRDLRNLRSEREAEQAQAAYEATSRAGEYRALRDAFAAANPEPPPDDFEGRADWEWRLSEHIYEAMDRDGELHMHRMERGAYVARVAERLRQAQAFAEDFWRPLTEAPRPLTPREPTPWPIGDGISRWRRQRGEPDAFGDLLPDEVFDEPSYAACLDLSAGLRGFRRSLGREQIEQTGLFRDAAEGASLQITLSYEPEYLPGTIGQAQVHVRDGVLLAQDALGLLDGLSGYGWLAPPAYARLRELLEAVCETGAARYAELRAVYDAYYALAARRLGAAGAPAEPRLSSATLPASYDDFDPEAHDREAERLDRVLLDHHNDDLRSLRSEVEAERYSARLRSGNRGAEWGALRKAFEAAHPAPSRDEPAARAAWEWALRAHILEGLGNEYALHRHRLEKGAYIERYRAMFKEWKDRAAEARRLHEEAPPRPRPPEERPSWPVGDGVSEIRREAAEIAAEYGDDDPEPEGALDEPSYDATLDLDAGLSGWWRSLPREAYPLSTAFSRAADEAVMKVRRAYKPEYRPGTIGQAMGHLRAGILHAEEALDLLDLLEPEPWLTPAADARLRELLGAVREAAIGRYVELRAVYDGYRERALRILGPDGVAGV